MSVCCASVDTAGYIELCCMRYALRSDRQTDRRMFRIVLAFSSLSLRQVTPRTEKEFCLFVFAVSFVVAVYLVIHMLICGARG